ncbi:MAG TPA: PepSY-like domain-containing protein [Cytophagaceae bacterium]
MKMKLVDKKIKGIILGALFVLFGFGVNAQDSGQQQEQTLQESDIAPEVLNTFEEEFASARDVEWKQKGDMIEAEFEENGEDKKAHFDNSGKLKMVKTEIRRKDLPQAVQQTLDTEYKDYKLDDFAKIEKDGKTHYKVEAEKGNVTKEMWFDPSGKQVEKDKSKSKEKSQRM